MLTRRKNVIPAVKDAAPQTGDKTMTRTSFNSILKTVFTLAFMITLSSCGAPEDQASSAQLKSGFTVTTNYLNDDKYGYSFSEWCSGQVPGATVEENYTVSKIKESIQDEGFLGDCKGMEDFLMNVQHKLVLTETTISDVSPLLSIEGAKKLRGVFMEHLGIRQSEVDKMDVLETLPSLMIFTLPDSAGKRSNCPLSNKEICN